EGGSLMRRAKRRKRTNRTTNHETHSREREREQKTRVRTAACGTSRDLGYPLTSMCNIMIEQLVVDQIPNGRHGFQWCCTSRYS
ncbi:unnamed protein product, partial [Trichogramma brassicae]